MFFCLSDNISSATITTAKLANSAVTTDKIADTSVTSAKIDWTTIRHPALTTTVITDYGTISTQGSRTMAQSGFLIGKAVTFASDTHAMVTLSADDDSYIVGGIPFTLYNDNTQIAFCIPVYKGQTIYFRKNGSAQFEKVKLVASHNGAAV